MIYIALAEAVVLALVVLAFLHFVAQSARAHARREDLLLNQMLNLAGKPWQPPPAAIEEPDKLEVLGYSWTPEQEFDAVPTE